MRACRRRQGRRPSWWGYGRGAQRVGEANTPTLIGADGAVYAINNVMLLSIAK